MHIIDFGTFVLPLRFPLTDLITGERDTVAAALRAELSEFTPLGGPESSGLLLDFHRSTGARQMETMLFEGVREVPGLGRVRLYLSSLSVCFVVVTIDLPDHVVADLETTGDRESFKSYETPVTDAVNVLVADWAARVERAVPAHLKQPRPNVAMAAGQLLWWHRVSVDPPAGREFPAARWYGVPVELADGVRVAIGNGFTNVHGSGAARAVDDVVEGLMVATQEWMIVDEAKRLLAEHLVRLAQGHNTNLISVDTQYLELLRLTEEVTLRNLLISEELRYLANARSRIRYAAMEAWHMADEAAELDDRITALRDLFVLHRERITNDRDNRRNRYVFVLTAVTLIQSILVWYDFVTSDDTTMGADPRPPIAIAVLVLTLLSIIGSLSWGVLVEGRRRQRLRRQQELRHLPRPRVGANGREDSPARARRTSTRES